MVKKILLFLCLILLISCKKNEDSASNVTWIGGEIVNPRGDYVIFFKDEHILDSVKLDENNFFLYRAEGIKTGLYSFHHIEFQVMFIEPGDSLMLRVNTIDFDESLSYTGKGAEKNNFLMDMFLHNEMEIELMPKLYRLPPKEFEIKLDSLKKIKTDLFEEFKIKYKSNARFEEVAEASINYDYFSKKELYTSANAGKISNDTVNKFPEGFYNYRKEIDFGSENLRSYFPYYRFLYRYFDNLASKKYSENGYYNKNSFKHNYNKIKIIDSLVTNDSLKNSLVKNIAGRYLLKCNNPDKQKRILDIFLKINTNNTHHRTINELAESSMKLTPGNKIPNLLLITTENTLKDLQSIIYRPTVFFFWSSNSVNHYKNIHIKVAELKSKYPEYNYIGINTDDNYINWSNTVTKYGYIKGQEYQFENIGQAEKKLVIYSVNKAIIVDKKGSILEGSTNLFNLNFEETLQSFLNNQSQ